MENLTLTPAAVVETGLIAGTCFPLETTIRLDVRPGLPGIFLV